jgi:hypothetical protein
MDDDFGVLIVGYRRLDNILNLVEEVISSGVKEIFIALDRLNDPKGLNEQIQFLSKIHELQDEKQIEIKVRHQTENLGAAVSVLTSIDWISESCRYFAVLEDDLVISHSFLKFAEESLRYFENNERILVISGNNYFGSQLTSIGFTRVPLTWGWATSRKKWEKARPHILSSKNDFSKSWNLSSNVILKQFLLAGKRRSIQGLIDAWDLPLASYMYENNMLCVLPGSNLVSNIGYDEFALHTNEKSIFHDFQISSELTELEFPTVIVVSKNIERKIAKEIYQVKFLNIFSALLQKRLDSTRNGKPKFEESLPNRVKNYGIKSQSQIIHFNFGD